MPSDTSVPPIPYDHYLPYAELVELLQGLAAARPDLMRLEVIGTSHEGREIYAATVTRFSTGLDSEKPAFWVDANIHATEVSPTTAALTLIHKLLAEDGTDADVTRMLDTRAFYVCPRVNPDGAELFLCDRPRYIRSSTRPYPWDEEPIEGLRRDDVDGDGRVLTMRIADPNGAWKAHPEEPKLMVRREPAEAGGSYYRLLTEGVVDNYDGVMIPVQRIKEGLDLNRNFPGHWRQEHAQVGAGPYPTSEPEVRSIVAFITAHPNITGAVTFHTHSGVLLRPYGTESDDAFPAEDLWTYEKIGAKGTEITGYPAINVFADFKYHPKEVITGVFDDWMYDHLGVFAWTTELWSPQKQAGIENPKPMDWFREHPVEDDLKLLKWADEHLPGRGYVDWYPFDHPQLGPVEIGGWDPIVTFRNPPPHLLEAEVKPHADWLIWQSLISPKLELFLAEAAPVGEGAYRVRLVVHNTGWLPSYVTKKALERKVVRGVIAEIELPEGAELAAGLPRQEGPQLEGRAYKPAAPLSWTSDPTADRAKFEWVVRAPAGGEVALTARHERAGVIRTRVSLAG
jgi:murein tripeptide amidase MpaA